MKTRVTVESITAELDAVAQGAVGAEQWSAAQAAIVSKAKLHGLLIDRKETGQPGDFAALTTAAEVLALVQAELGADVAAAISAALARAAPAALAAPGLEDADQVADQVQAESPKVD